MLFFDIFDDKLHWVLSGLAFVFFIISTWYAKRLKIGRGLNLLLGGVLIIFVTSLLQSFSNYFYEQAVSVKILTFAEMILVLTSSVLLIMASSQILMNEPLNTNIIFAFITVGLLLTVYAIFIVNDANIVANIRQILPIIGMTYIFLSFVSRPRLWHYPGEMLAATAAAGFVVLMTLPMLSPAVYPWYLPVDLMILLGFSYYLMENEELKLKLSSVEEIQNRTTRNIENIIKSSPFPIIISRLLDDTLLIANNNAIKLFGLAETEISRYHLKDFFVDTENRRLLTCRLEKDKEVHDFEVLVKTASGNTPFWLLASVNVIDYNNAVVLYSAFQDITARKRRESFLQSQADRDPLTEIYNRRYFESAVVQKIKESHERREPFAVLMIDADHFKKINDTYGHKTGDKVLIELASVCERALRQEDLVARYGGEEFVVFLNNVNAEIALMVANRLKEAIANSVIYADDNQEVRFTVSVGVAPSGISDNVSMMIKMADDAMYLAKQNGRNRVELFNRENIDRLNLEQNQTVNDKSQIHPAFSNEENEEISLLDDIGVNRLGEE